MKTKTLTTLFFFIYLFSYSQTTKTFFISGGLTYPSYHSPLGSGPSFFINVRIEKHFDLFLGTATTEYSGFGYGTGLRIYPFTKLKFLPFIGFAFDDFYYGHHFYINEKETKKHYDPNESSNYYTERNKFYIPFIGLRKDFSLRDDEPNTNKQINFSLLATFSYRKADIEKTVIFTGGIQRDDFENKINQDLASGLGGSISLLYHFNRRQKK